MKAKLLAILAVVVFVYSSVMLVSAETQTNVWRDDMNYQSLGQLQAAGWTITHEDGVSFSGSAIVIDGTQEDTAIHFSNHFPSGILNWKVEDKSRWTLGSHCGNIVTAITNKHSYGFAADGWYGNYAFYRDGQKTTFASFQESKNTWFTLSIEKQGNQISMYYNGELKSTYTETDSSTSQLIGVDAVSPWKGGSEYDYFEVWQIEATSTQEAQQSLLSNPLVIGGIIGAVGVGVGGVLYFFVLGGSGGGAAGGAAGGAGSPSAGGGGSIIQDLSPSPPSGGASTNPSGTSSSLSGGLLQFAEQMENITDINNFWNDFIQDSAGNIFASAEPTNPAIDTTPSNIIGNGSSNGTPQTNESSDPILHSQNLTSSILQTMDQGEQLATEAYTQGTLSLDGYQHYLEMNTQIMQAMTQATEQQSNAAHQALSGASVR